MKHTKGEWPIDRHCGRIESIGPLYAAADAADDTDLHAWLEVTDEDANLISAAPDLLAALQWSIQFAEQFAREHNDGPTMATMIGQCRAAMAKATGAKCDT